MIFVLVLAVIGTIVVTGALMRWFGLASGSGWTGTGACSPTTAISVGAGSEGEGGGAAWESLAARVSQLEDRIQQLGEV